MFNVCRKDDTLRSENPKEKPERPAQFFFRSVEIIKIGFSKKNKKNKNKKKSTIFPSILFLRANKKRDIKCVLYSDNLDPNRFVSYLRIFCFHAQFVRSNDKERTFVKRCSNDYIWTWPFEPRTRFRNTLLIIIVRSICSLTTLNARDIGHILVTIDISLRNYEMDTNSSNSINPAKSIN